MYNDHLMAVVWEDEFFVITPCRDCDVAGYLILQTKVNAAQLSDLPVIALERLGIILCEIEAAIIATTQAERVYILRFSEGTASVHFHLFPRTKELAASWSSTARKLPTSGIYGEYLYGWARIERHVPSSDLLSHSTIDTAKRISAILSQRLTNTR